MLRHIKSDDISNEETNSTTDAEESELQPTIPPSAVQFWTFLIFEIPSLACTIFLLYHLILNKRLRTALHNHIVMILLFLTLIIEIFDNPLYMDAYRLGGNMNSFTLTPGICLMWWFIDVGFYGAISVLLAWGALERHILVFHHHRLLRTRKQRLWIHYFPLVIISLYILVFYIIVIFFPPCTNVFDFESLACGITPCYEQVPLLNSWDYLGNGILCTFIETVCSVALIVRVLWQKRRLRQPMNWRKHRKMAIQILSISCISLTIIFPQSLIIVIQQVGGPSMSSFGAGAMPYFFYLYTFVVFLLPFISLGCLPELWPKLLFFWPNRSSTVGMTTSPQGAPGPSTIVRLRRT
ncbi:unnamed protein product [Adineta ricciae]|uniref:Uncharacterized protein n=1 Tax=Adineta ricciae TaxID=249248 RepID=A0A813V7C5_ADIRI|nr:unnamed protein product [Adineta ricciae]